MSTSFGRTLKRAGQIVSVLAGCCSIVLSITGKESIVSLMPWSFSSGPEQETLEVVELAPANTPVESLDTEATGSNIANL